MVEKEKLESYSKRYEGLKEEIFEASVVRSELERQQIESNNRIIKLSNDISDKQADIYFEIREKKQKKVIFLKNRLIRDILADLLGGTLLISIGCIVIELPLILMLGVSSVITISQIISNIVRYKKNFNKCSMFNINNSYDNKIMVLNIGNDEINELDKERSKELSKNNEIQRSLDIVNERLENLGEIKLDIENLIICLFSSLDNIIKNKSDKQNPFYTWLNISYEEEPKLEISSTMKRVRNKKENK